MDWDKIVVWAGEGLAQLWSFVVVALLVYAFGAMMKMIGTKKRWRGTEEDPSWFDIWMRVMPFQAGAMIGVIPFPCLNVIERIGDGHWNPPEVAARVGWFMLSGALCGQVYELGQFAFAALKKKIALKAKEV